MGIFATALLTIFIAAAAGIGSILQSHVESERWQVKTLADHFMPDSLVIASSIDEQISMKPSSVGETVGRLGGERTVYSLTAILVGFKREIDNDYHLILEDPISHHRMIAEIPSPDCDAPLAIRLKYRNARRTIDQLVGEPPFLFTHTFDHPITIGVVGVGFFDEDHEIAQEGMSENNREIHPVLRIIPK